MHEWEDSWPYWKDLYKAEKVLNFWGKKIGRIGGQSKEKWGEIRWSAHIGGELTLHDLVYPSSYGYRWSAQRTPFMHWLNNLSKSYICYLKIPILVHKKFMYGLAYSRACSKYPHIAPEILSCAEHVEFLFEKERKWHKLEELEQQRVRENDEQT